MSNAHKSSGILIVEADATIRESFEKFLLEEKYNNIFTAGNGKEALKVFSKNPDNISIILLDLHLHEMPGIEFISLLKEMHKFPVGIIGTTSSKEKGDIFYKSGSDSIITLNYLVKPFYYEDALTAVNDAVEVIQNKGLEHIKEYSESLLSELNDIRSRLDQIINDIKSFLNV